jgi:DNA-binding transcriptional LysR family regulator
MNFTLKQLRYFTKAGELSSVTAAAQALHVSQPSISSAILHLEEVTGLQLFVRHHAQGLSLTPAGQKFMRKAQQLLADAEDLGQYAHTLTEQVSGSLKIAGFPTFSPMLMPALMRKFLQTYPQVTLECDELHQQDIISQLTNGRYELAVTYDLQLSNALEFEPIIEFPAYVVLSEHHALAKRESLSLVELAEHPMVLLDWPLSREYFFSLFLSHGVEPNFAYRANSLGMVRGLVSNGFGYSLFNSPMVNKMALDGSMLRAIPIEGKQRPLRLGVAKMSQLQLSPAALAFVEILKTQVIELGHTVFEEQRFCRSVVE